MGEKGEIVSILGFVGHRVSDTTTQLRCYSTQAVTDDV